METTPVLFLSMLGIAVFLLVWNLVVPVFGSERKAARRLRKRLKNIAVNEERPSAAAMLREKYLKDLSPLEKQLESLPGMDRLALYIEQSGREYPANRLVLMVLAFAALAGGAAWYLVGNFYLSVPVALVAACIPLVRIHIDRVKRLARFEEQLPEALDIIVRALKSGHPFAGSLRLVAEEMEPPIAKEFNITFADINYGLDIKKSFLNLLERVPNITLMTVVTAVIVQRETGGNLAETLANISSIVRGRFRFQRRVKTLSAEGKMSAWVLVMVPFALFLGLMITTPSYLTILIEHPLGIKIVGISFTMIVIGIFWLKRIIRINV